MNDTEMIVGEPPAPEIFEDINLAWYCDRMNQIPMNQRPPLFFNPEQLLGRNDPCFCGSGKKYKKCCMK